MCNELVNLAKELLGSMREGAARTSHCVWPGTAEESEAS